MKKAAAAVPAIKGWLSEKVLMVREGENLDDFREWLSDNLRYFMLGGGILLVVLVLFFGIRACTRLRKGDSEGDAQKVENDSQGDNTSLPETEGNAEGGEGQEDSSLEKNNEEIKSLLTKYYEALSENDITKLKSLVENLLPEDETRITNSNDFIEKYQLGDIYSQKGLTDDSRVVFACYDFFCSGIDTPAPALAQLYVVKNSDGEWKVDGSAWEDSRISDYTKELKKDQEVIDLVKSVQDQNDKARDSDPDLAKFLDGLGEEVIVSLGTEEETKTTMKVRVMCNVREAPSTDSQSLGLLQEGTEVQVLGDEGEWKKVEFEGKTAYIRGDLLE